MNLDEFTDRMIEVERRYMRERFRQEKNEVTGGLLTQPQYWSMRHLEVHTPCPVNELAEALNLSFSSVSGLVDRLVKLDMVDRERSTKDRRIVLLSLTAKGRKATKAAKDQQKKTLKKMFGALSSAERDQYLSLVEKLFEKLPEI